MEGNGNVGERGFFAADVIRILAHVGGVMHLASGGDVSDHALANFQAVTRAAQFASGATVGADQRQLAALLVVQVDVRIKASKRPGNLVYDLVDELIEVKDGADFLGSLLQLEEILHLIKHKQGRVRGSGCGGVWTGCHGSAPGMLLTKEMIWSMGWTLFCEGYGRFLEAFSSAREDRENALSPRRGSFIFTSMFPWLAPWAAFFRRSAA